jgi:hypothetical protein
MTTPHRTQAERTTALEVTVAALVEKQEETNKKLDQLLELKANGMGAVWLVSILVSSGVLALLGRFFGWWEKVS